MFKNSQFHSLILIVASNAYFIKIIKRIQWIGG